MQKIPTLSRWQKTISGDRVDLRILEAQDATAAYAAWLSNPLVHKYLHSRSTSVPNLKNYIQAKFESENALLFGIFVPSSQNRSGDSATPRLHHIGNIKLEPIDFGCNIATMGLLIGDSDYWGKGFGTESLMLVTDFAFKDLGMKAVELGVSVENTAAVRLYEKCGYEVYETAKDRIDPDGLLYDELHMRKIAPSSSS